MHTGTQTFLMGESSCVCAGSQDGKELANITGQLSAGWENRGLSGIIGGPGFSLSLSPIVSGEQTQDEGWCRHLCYQAELYSSWNTANCP